MSQATHRCLTNGSIYTKTHTPDTTSKAYTPIYQHYIKAQCACAALGSWITNIPTAVVSQPTALLFKHLYSLELWHHLFSSKVNSDEWLHFIKERRKWRFTVHRGINLERWHCGMLTNHHSYVSIHSFHVISAGHAHLAGKGYSTAVLCPPTILWTPLCLS